MILWLLLYAVPISWAGNDSSPLTAELIHRAVDQAAKIYLGDFTEGVVASHHEYFYGSFEREIREKYLSVFESFPATRDLLRLALPRPPRSQMLLLRPPSIELSSKP